MNQILEEDNFPKFKEALQKLDLQTKAKLIALWSVKEKRDKLDQQYDNELQVFEGKFQAQMVPKIDTQNQIINGEKELTEDELSQQAKYVKEGEKLDKANQKIEGYWQKVLKNSKTISKYTGEKDGPILKQLKSIQILPHEGTDNFGLEFTFNQNEYFTNEKLQVNFFIDKTSNEPTKVESTPIQWNQGKNVAIKIVKKRKKKVTKTQEQEQLSLFNLFRNIDLNSEQVKQQPKEQLEKTHAKMDMAFDIARLIYDEIVPYSLEYYLDVHVESDFEGDDADGLDGSDDDEDEEISKEEAIKRMKAKFGKK
ncbi:hypothetical protein pb186bvf_018639 [Paramecium bursaria]